MRERIRAPAHVLDRSKECYGIPFLLHARRTFQSGAAPRRSILERGGNVPPASHAVHSFLLK
jgi:hypothetical protein